MEYNMFLASDGNEILRNELRTYGVYAFYEYIERNGKYKSKIKALHSHSTNKAGKKHGKNR